MERGVLETYEKCAVCSPLLRQNGRQPSQLLCVQEGIGSS